MPALRLLFGFLSAISFSASLHAAENVAPPALRRSLVEYFKSSGYPSTSSVSVSYLRDGPTVTGIAWPKYYLWVAATATGKVVSEGAVRVADEDGTFKVTDYIPKDRAAAEPSAVSSVFPAPLVPKILALAGSK